jgi:CHAD domain-containing protein
MHEARRVLLDDIDKATRVLRRRSLGDEPLHTARKEMKRTRAGLRLLREALGNAAYRRLNRSIRDAARPLTPARDAKVLLEALASVLRSAGESAQNDLASKLRRALQEQRRASRDELSSESLNGGSTRLKEAAQALKILKSSRLDHARVDDALKRAYKKAYEAFALARREPSNECLHEWRKQVKYHFHQLEILQPLKPRRIGKTLKRAHRLADHLGDDHDLALLHEVITLHATQASSDTSAATALIKELKRRRVKLQRKSYRLGSKLYADKPKRAARRARKYLEASRPQNKK